MKTLREEFKAQAQTNENIFKDALGDDFENLWNFVSKCNECINICLNKVYEQDEKKSFSIITLRNSVSDILCCLDALERGHEQTVWNNLRMVFESFCLIFHMHNENHIFEALKQGKHKTPKSVTYTTSKLRYKESGYLYGELSKISHQSQFALFARQLIASPRTTAIFSHIKPISQDKFIPQINFLLFISFLLRSIAELTEEICINELVHPYFLKKNEAGFQRNLNTKEDEFIQNLCTKAEAILKTNSTR
jgi:hypothetical protein